jgi:hypothetical protein
MLLLELGGHYHTTSTTQGETKKMARQTRIKLAALATSLVAAVGIIAVSPATADNAGGVHHSLRDRMPCC